jgi:thiamine pyrophosphokinase
MFFPPSNGCLLGGSFMLNYQRACIFANGTVENPTFIQSHLTPNDLLIAADGGSKTLTALGLIPHILIGDLDSTSKQQLLSLTNHQTIILRYPQAKNETDLELALQYALDQKFSEILIFGALGGRWDMSLANLFLLTYPFLQKNLTQPIKISIIEPNQTFNLITQNSPLIIFGKPDDTVSLLPLSPIVEGVETDNLLYPLRKKVYILALLAVLATLCLVILLL